MSGIDQPSMSRDNRRDVHGRPLVPGVNVDKIDVKAGLNEAAKIDYDTPEDFMVVEYALMRHKRGEEEGARKTVLNHGIDLTSWYRILAAAISAGERAL